MFYFRTNIWRPGCPVIHTSTGSYCPSALQHLIEDPSGYWLLWNDVVYVLEGSPALLNERIYFPYKERNETSSSVTSTRRSAGNTTYLLSFSMSSPPWSSLSLFLRSPLSHCILSKPGAPSCCSDLQSNHILLFTAYNQITPELLKIKRKDIQGKGYHLPALRRGSWGQDLKTEMETVFSLVLWQLNKEQLLFLLLPSRFAASGRWFWGLDL